MKLEEAIQTALAYETRIRDLYYQAVAEASDPAGKRIFEALGMDEQHHVDYLEDRLEQWLKTEKLSIEHLESTLPPKEKIQNEVDKLKADMKKEDRRVERQMLSKALKVEVETSNFYKKMVAEMEGGARAMFARFLEIEDEHIAIVQAELDYNTKTGYWFDIKEFDME